MEVAWDDGGLPFFTAPNQMVTQSERARHRMLTDTANADVQRGFLFLCATKIIVRGYNSNEFYHVEHGLCMTRMVNVSWPVP